MKWESTDFRVGASVLGAAALLIAAIIWLSPTGRQRTEPLYTLAPELQGIGVETPVFLNGWTVGRVGDVRPVVDAHGNLQFRLRLDVRMRLEDGSPLPLRAGTRARLVPPQLDVVGAGTVILEQPPGAAPPLAAGATLPAVLERRATDRATAVMDTLTQELRLTLSAARTSMAAADRVLATLGTAAGNAERLTASANDQVPAILNDVRARLAGADSALHDVRAITPAAVAMMDSVQMLVRDSRGALARLSTAVDANEPRLATTLANLDTTSVLLQHFVREISRRPLKVLTGVSEPVQAGRQRPDTARR